MATQSRLTSAAEKLASRKALNEASLWSARVQKCEPNPANCEPGHTARSGRRSRSGANAAHEPARQPPRRPTGQTALMSTISIFSERAQGPEDARPQWRTALEPVV